MPKLVGFDQKIVLEDLDFTAQEASRTERAEMYYKLDQHLLARVKGNKSRKNTITILMKIWYSVDKDCVKLHQEALKLLGDSSQDGRLVLHWGMTLLAYPLFHDLVKELGTLFALQDGVASSQIRRKMKSLYGDRRRVEVATSAVLSSLYSWGVLRRTKGVYDFATIEIKKTELKIWFLNVLLKASDKNAAALEVLMNTPEAFPFEYSLLTPEFDNGPLTINKQGLDMSVVSYR